MALDREQVRKIAFLARLSLSDEELSAVTADLEKIVGLVDQLSELDTTNVEPLVHAIELQNVLAADEVRTSISREAALENAPDADHECFRVPAVLG